MVDSPARQRVQQRLAQLRQQQTGVAASGTTSDDNSGILVTKGQALDIMDRVVREAASQGTQVKRTRLPTGNLSAVMQGRGMAAPQAQPQQPAQQQPTQQQPVQPQPAQQFAQQSVGQMAQVVPRTVAQATDTLNPSFAAQAVSTTKETLESSASSDTSAVEAGGAAAGQVEFEPQKEFEVPVEVEAYMEKVDQHQDQLPQEIVVADDNITISEKKYPTQPVVVLPITPETEKKGKRKSPKFSLRWLIEWSQKIVKVLSGEAIYKQVDS